MHPVEHLYYYSTIWSFHWAAEQMRQFTSLAQTVFVNAGIGANFMPADYLSESWKWIDVFRSGALTTPWAEGYAFAFTGPLTGSHQIVELRQAMRWGS